MQATIHGDIWHVLNMQYITQMWQDGIILTSMVVALKILKDPLMWLANCASTSAYQLNSNDNVLKCANNLKAIPTYQTVQGLAYQIE